jgi:hypothetical protein
MHPYVLEKLAAAHSDTSSAPRPSRRTLEKEPHRLIEQPATLGQAPSAAASQSHSPTRTDKKGPP